MLCVRPMACQDNGLSVLWLLRHMVCLTISFVRPVASQVYCFSDKMVCLAGCVSSIPGTQVVCMVWKVEVCFIGAGVRQQ